jgi:hypothetical protein
MVMSRHSIKTDIKYPLIISFLGLFLVVLLTAFPPTVTSDFSWRKPVIGSVFSVICILGVCAVFLPNKCLGILRAVKKNNVASNSVKPALHGNSNTLQGHHPTCGKYDAHITKINGKTVCAACTGLLLGAILALIGAWVYFFGGWSVTEDSSLLVLLGVVGICFGLFQFKFRSLFRLAMNTVFVLGALLILIGVDALIGSLVFDLFVVSLVFFWLYTRVSLSQWDHELICSGCDAKNCGVRE